jgi:ABC-type cobalamin/Fe3+-siderophores transport system ATPase subunit
MSYSAKNLSVFKDNKNIINEISFDFPSGSYVSIIGPNGAGKTTLLKTLAGLLDFKGSLLINNVDSDELFKYSNKNNCAYVPQNISIPEGMSLIEYVLLGRNSYTNWFLSEDKKDYEIVEKALNKLNLQTKIMADGSIKHHQTEGSIHKVAATILGAESCNGWTYWYYKLEGSFVPIDNLRRKFLVNKVYL